MTLKDIFLLLDLLKERMSAVVKHPLRSLAYQCQSNLLLQQIYFFSNKKAKVDFTESAETGCDLSSVLPREAWYDPREIHFLLKNETLWTKREAVPSSWRVRKKNCALLNPFHSLAVLGTRRYLAPQEEPQLKLFLTGKPGLTPKHCLRHRSLPPTALGLSRTPPPLLISAAITASRFLSHLSLSLLWLTTGSDTWSFSDVWPVSWDARNFSSISCYLPSLC